jgi:hypothetical protein
LPFFCHVAATKRWQLTLNAMKNHVTTHRGLKGFSTAVLTSAAALGIARAVACTEPAGYYVAFQTPSGYLTRTEAAPNERTALFSFEKAAMHSIYHKH